MFVHCIFCHRHLGSNRQVEHFPVGRRLSFDASRGRLWVVCIACGRWNLTPLEERWEAIEDCERLFRRTRARVTTDEIGLAQTRDGLQLIRVGKPLWPEFASWRYGAQFRSRVLRRLMYVAGAGAAIGGYALVGPVAGVLGLSAIAAARVGRRSGGYVSGNVVARVPTGPKSLIKFVEVRGQELQLIELGYDAAARGFAITVPSLQGEWHLRGERALPALRHVLPAINEFGGGRRVVRGAIAEIERLGDSARFLNTTAKRAKYFWDCRLSRLPAETRLAMEMAVNEESERSVLEGELSHLLAAWREAERIAKISDDMFLPRWIHRVVQSHGTAL